MCAGLGHLTAGLDSLVAEIRVVIVPVCARSGIPDIHRHSAPSRVARMPKATNDSLALIKAVAHGVAST